MRLLILGLALLTGCAAAHTPVIHYGPIAPFTLIHRPQSEVQRARGVPSGVRVVRCFFNHASREMWVSWGHEDCIPHELAHAEGLNEDQARAKVRP